ncbi:MAG: SDR family oxidoreductase [Bacteroidota bacterium]
MNSQTVLIIGGSSGIGKATAIRFATEGWKVLIAAPDLPACREVVEQLPGTGHLAVATDVTEDSQIEELRKTVEERWGGFQVLINCAGLSRKVSLIDSDFAKWDQLVQIMLYGSVKACRALVPLMNDGGRIIHITSVHQDRVAPGSSAYGMAKGALTQMVRALALELAPRGILSNAISPGFIHTPMSIKEDGKNELETPWFYDNYVKYDHLPLLRAGQPEEVAGVAWFLAGPDASYMTGSVLRVDGGLTITF